MAKDVKFGFGLCETHCETEEFDTIDELLMYAQCLWDNGDVPFEDADKHGFRIPYDGSNNYYDDVDVKTSKEGFIEGALWKEKQYFKAGINATARPDDMELWANLDGLHLEDGDSVRVVVIKSPKDVKKLKEK